MSIAFKGYMHTIVIIHNPLTTIFGTQTIKLLVSALH